jgi:hypothetical protein
MKIQRVETLGIQCKEKKWMIQKGRGPNEDDSSGEVYMSYLLRLWQTESRNHGEAGHSWFASLEAPFTHDRSNFPDLASLFTYIEDRTRRRDEPNCEQTGVERIDTDK